MVVNFYLTLQELCFLNKALMEMSSRLFYERDKKEKGSDEYVRLSKEAKIFSDLSDKLFY